MKFAAPSMLYALGLLVPIVIAFLVFRKRTTLRVPSTMVWRLGAKSVAKNRRLRDLRRWIALAACLLAVAALVLSAARPSTGAAGGNAVFVIDVSASMAGEPFTNARRFLAREAAAMGPNDRMAIVAAGRVGRVVLPPSGPGPALDDALRKLAPEPATAALDEAVAMAEGLAGGSARVVVLSDSPIDVSTSTRAFKPTARVFQQPIRENVGIVSMFVRAAPDARDEEEREVTVSVASSSAKPRRVRVTMQQYDAALGAKDPKSPPMVERMLEIAPRSESHARIAARGGGRFVARVSAADGEPDAVSIDDEANVTEPARKPLRVAFVRAEPKPEEATARHLRHLRHLVSDTTADGPAAFFVERALKAAGPGEIVEVDPTEPAAAPVVVDVAVVLSDGPSRPKGVPSFFIGVEPTETALVSRRIGDAESRLRSMSSSDPLLRGVMLDDLTTTRAKVAAAPARSRVLVDLDGGPTLIVAGAAEHSWVWLGISPDASDLALRVAFPVLVGNVLAHLGGTARVVSAETVPRAEVRLVPHPVGTALSSAPDPKWRLPIGLPVLLAGLAALLLVFEAWFSLRPKRWAT